MRKLRWEEYFAVPAMVVLITASLLFVPPPANAYTIPNTTTQGFIVGQSTASQTLTIANAGDLIVVMVQLYTNSGTISVSAVSGTLGDSSYILANTATFQGTGTPCSITCAGAWIFYATSTSSGVDTITVNLAGSCDFLVCAFEAIDAVGVPASVQGTAQQVEAVGNTTSNFNTLTSLPLSGASTLAVGSDENLCTGGHIFSPGAGFNVTTNGGSQVGAGEYGTPTTGPMSPTNFPMSCNIPIGNWVDIGVVFGGPTTVIVVIPCTAFQLQCWWYPFFFFGVYMILIVGMAVKAKVPKPDLLGLTIEAFSLASLLAVMLGIINIMFPLIITIVQVIRAIRE